MRGRVVLFFGGGKCVGTTLISLNFAIKTARKFKDKKVIFLGLNEGSFTHYVKESTENIESIVHLLDNDLLVRGFLSKAAGSDQGIWYIGGPENIIASGTYKPDVAQKLIEHARDEFDYVIVDAGENLNNGLTMGALNVEDKDLITVLNQRESNVKGLEMRLKLLVKMGIEIGKLLMNMYDGTDPYDIKYMSERLGMDKGDIISIPYTYELKECEREHDVLQDRNKLFHREMSKFIESYYGGPVREKRRLLGKILC